MRYMSRLPILSFIDAEILAARNANEAKQKHPVDSLVHLVFGAGTSSCYVEHEVKIALRESNIVACSEATTDVVVHRWWTNDSVNGQLQTSMLGFDIQRYYWRSSVNLEEFTIIVLPIEHKHQEKGDTSNQLLFNLATSLCHRTAIHMSTDHTYGATCESGRFTLWSGTWVSTQQENWVYAVPIKTWNLYDFRELLEVFLVLHFVRDKSAVILDAYEKESPHLDLNTDLAWRGSVWRTQAVSSEAENAKDNKRRFEGDDSTRQPKKLCDGNMSLPDLPSGAGSPISSSDNSTPPPPASFGSDKNPNQDLGRNSETSYGGERDSNKSCANCILPASRYLFHTTAADGSLDQDDLGTPSDSEDDMAPDAQKSYLLDVFLAGLRNDPDIPMTSNQGESDTSMEDPELAAEIDAIEDTRTILYDMKWEKYEPGQVEDDPEHPRILLMRI